MRKDQIDRDERTLGGCGGECWIEFYCWNDGERQEVRIEDEDLRVGCLSRKEVGDNAVSCCG